jgi:acyl-CoA thioester hydrolase
VPQPFVWQSRVAFVDTDASQRIHYTAMLKHFEAAESEFLRSLGFSYRDMKKLGLDWPRVHVDCDYFSPPFYDDLMDIAVSVERVGRTSFTLAFDVTIAGVQVSKGRITVVCVRDGKAHPLPEVFAATLSSTQKG